MLHIQHHCCECHECRKCCRELIDVLDRIATAVEKIAAPPVAVSTAIVLSQPVSTSKGTTPMAKVQLNRAKTVRKTGPNITFPQLAAAGGLLVALDKGGNVVPGGIDPTKTTVAWASSDDAVITVSVPDPADTTKATLRSTGKVGTGITVTATLTNNDGSTPLPPAVSDGIDVPAGNPTNASIQIGVPA